MHSALLVCLVAVCAVGAAAEAIPHYSCTAVVGEMPQHECSLAFEEPARVQRCKQMGDERDQICNELQSKPACEAATREHQERCEQDRKSFRWHEGKRVHNGHPASLGETLNLGGGRSTSLQSILQQDLEARNTMEYDGHLYAVMDDTPKSDTNPAGCQSSFITMPEGWTLVPYSAEICKHVAWSGSSGTYSWGTGWVQLNGADGMCHTNMNKRDKRNFLASSGNSYKAKACSIKVLIRTPTEQTTPPTPPPTTHQCSPDLQVCSSDVGGFLDQPNQVLNQTNCSISKCCKTNLVNNTDCGAREVSANGPLAASESLSSGDTTSVTDAAGLSFVAIHPSGKSTWSAPSSGLTLASDNTGLLSTLPDSDSFTFMFWLKKGRVVNCDAFWWFPGSLKSNGYPDEDRGHLLRGLLHNTHGKVVEWQFQVAAGKSSDALFAERARVPDWKKAHHGPAFGELNTFGLPATGSGVWNHFAIVIGEHTRFYINGEPFRTAWGDFRPMVRARFNAIKSAGAMKFAFGPCAEAVYSDFRFYPQAISHASIRSLVRASEVPKTSPCPPGTTFYLDQPSTRQGHCYYVGVMSRGCFPACFREGAVLSCTKTCYHHREYASPQYFWVTAKRIICHPYKDANGNKVQKCDVTKSGTCYKGETEKLKRLWGNNHHSLQNAPQHFIDGNAYKECLEHSACGVCSAADKEHLQFTEDLTASA